MQKYVKINEIDIPIVRDRDTIYYPISFISDKVLLKVLTGNQLIQNGYSDYIKQLEIDYGETTGGIQKTYCICEKGLKEVLKRSRIGRLSVEQKVAMNELLSYLGMNKIDTGERFIDILTKDKINQYSLFIQDCINEVLKEKPDIKWQKCTKCNNYYPYDINFFKENLHSSAELNTVCRDCQKWSESRGRISINHPNKDLNSAYKNYGEDVFLMYKNHDTLGIYKHCIEKRMRYIPSIIHNKEDYFKIIKHYYELGEIKDLQLKVIEKDYKLNGIYTTITMHGLYEYLFGIDYKKFPWKYPLVRLSDINLTDAKEIFNNYLNEYNINIDNFYDFDFVKIINACGLRWYASENILDCVMELLDNKYGAYKFKKVVGQNYWKNKEKVNQALKFYIEEDQKIPLEKIPLYVTLNNLQKNARTLYNIIHDKRFHKTLFEWVNDVYPNMFDERDFSIGSIRNYFDSNEEEIVYNYLKDRFKNVIYNKRNCENTINLKGIIPDYIIFTDNSCWLVEYFGLYVPEKMGESKRISDYVKKTDKKINTYKTIRHNKIFIYPNDLLDGMKGLEEKIKDIV